MAPIENKYQANYANALGTAVIGGAAWGVGQYLFNKKPFVDQNNVISDSFVKTMEDSLLKINDKPTLENIELQKNIEKEIEKITKVDDLKVFLTKHKDDFTRISEDDIKIINDDIAKMELDKSKEYAKAIFKKDGKYIAYYNETLESCYDDLGKKLVHNPEKMSAEKFKTLKNIVNKNRINSALKTAGLFTVVCATCCCLFEFFLSKKKN